MFPVEDYIYDQRKKIDACLTLNQESHGFARILNVAAASMHDNSIVLSVAGYKQDNQNLVTCLFRFDVARLGNIGEEKWTLNKRKDVLIIAPEVALNLRDRMQSNHENLVTCTRVYQKDQPMLMYRISTDPAENYKVSEGS